MVRDRDAKHRRLAAIVFTDIVGFSALVNRDEALGARSLDLQRRIVRKLVPAFGGREIETAGDSFLLEFASAFAALRCVVAIQQTLKREPAAVPGDPPVRLRASIHLGDIEHRGREVFGDGVNIAARLMPMSPEGGIAISDQVHSQVRQRLAVAACSIGACELKNIRYPVEVFVLDDKAVDAIPVDLPGAGQTQQGLLTRHGLWRFAPVLVALVTILGLGAFTLRGLSGPVVGVSPDKASLHHRIAVLPFSSFSVGDADALLAFGLQDSVLTNLARIEALQVTSRTSVMQYTDRGTRNVKAIASELGVDTIVEGSLQRQGDRLLVQIQLIDAANDRHLWAQSFDRKIDDLFAVESAVSQQIADAVSVAVSKDVREAITAAPTASLDAYNEYLRAQRLLDEGNSKLPEAEAAIGKALALDPNFALARLSLSRIHVTQYKTNIDRSPARLDMARRELLKVSEIQPGLPQLHSAWGRYYLYGKHDVDAAISEYELALRLLPNDVPTLTAISEAYTEKGRIDEARTLQRRAMEIDPNSQRSYLAMAGTYHLQRDYANALHMLDRAEQVGPVSDDLTIYRAWLILAMNGDVSAARSVLGSIDDPATLEKFAYYAGDYDEAIRQVKRQPAWQGGDVGSAAYPAIASIAVDLWLKGDRDGAAEQFRKVVPLLEAELKKSDEAQWDQRTTLALAQAFLGRREAARVQLEIVRKDCCDNPATRSDILVGIAYCELLLEDKDAAIAALDELLAQPSYMSWHLIAMDRLWDPLRKDPRFAGMLARASTAPAAGHSALIALRPAVPSR